MTQSKLPLIFLALLFVCQGSWADTRDTKTFNCGTVNNPRGSGLAVEIVKTGEKAFVSVKMSDPATKNRAWYHVSIDGWDYIVKSYEKAWTVKKQGVVGNIKANEFETKSSQPLGIVASPGKGVVFLGVGTKGRLGVALSSKEKDSMDKIVKKYRVNANMNSLTPSEKKPKAQKKAPAAKKP